MLVQFSCRVISFDADLVNGLRVFYVSLELCETEVY